MSNWAQHEVEAAVIAVLQDVPLRSPDGHAFGRPFLTAYQLAIAIQRDHHLVFEALGLDVGGKGTGEPETLSRYLARVLSSRIRDHDDSYPIEGAFLSNEDLVAMEFVDNDGGSVSASFVGAAQDLSMFRLRPQA